MQKAEFAHSRGMSANVPHRSTSGQSTASSASSGLPEQTYAVHPRFARLREQSTISESDSRHGAQVVEDFATAASINSLTRFNTTSASAMEAHAPHYSFQGQPSGTVDASYNQTASRPSSRQTDVRERTSTPLVGATGTDGEKDKKKSTSSTAANEKELRDMLDKNQGRDLASIAREVRNAERSQKAERAKQLYAMRW